MCSRMWRCDVGCVFPDLPNVVPEVSKDRVFLVVKSLAEHSSTFENEGTTLL
jgi:hypothetical protein